MRRFFVDRIQAVGGTMIIRGAEARHICSVLRMGRGDRLILMDEMGRRCRAQIQSIGRREVEVVLEEALEPPAPSPVDITLCQAVLKSPAMDDVVRKASELGVNRIIPFTSRRTVVQIGPQRASVRLEHWQTIARDAAKQSDRRTPAEISSITSLEDMLGGLEDALASKLVLWEQEQTQDLKGLLRSDPPAGGRCIGIVGPEGGFSEEEIRIVRNAGFLPVSMGNRILRAGTAALALVGIIQYEWGDLGLRNFGP